MTKIANLAGIAFLSLLMFPAHGYAGPADQAPATEDLRQAFVDVVDSAVDQCRAELAGDVFANFRLEACVEKKVADSIERSGASQLAAYAAGQGDVLFASAP